MFRPSWRGHSSSQIHTYIYIYILLTLSLVLVILICVYIYIYIYVCMYVCMYIYIYIYICICGRRLHTRSHANQSPLESAAGDPLEASGKDQRCFLRCWFLVCNHSININQFHHEQNLSKSIRLFIKIH